ncbi:MAG: methyl-accepting chemotaxis protein [Lachnospiraceae bacterium]|nr:methyl-accepting chemotaxis protein [Lachnospiraceae bacterium]
MNSSEKGSSASISRRLLLLTFGLMLLTCIILGGISIYFLRSTMNSSIDIYENAMYEGYRTEIKSQVQSSIAIVQSFYDRSAAGELSEADAKKAAAEAVRALRYRDDASGYMWIDATDYTLVMHPILPDQEGNNRYDLTDQNGVKIIQNIMKEAQAGGGYNEFYFTKADGVTVAPKLAYSELFEPWGWVITTGNYTDDMDAEMEEQEKGITSRFGSMFTAFIICVIILLVAGGFLAVIFGNRIAGGIKKLANVLSGMSDGDLSVSIPDSEANRRDEVGMIARSVLSLREKMNSILSDINEQSRHISLTNDDFTQRFADITENVQNVNNAVEDIANGSTSLANEATSAGAQAVAIGKVIEENSQSIQRLEETVQRMNNEVSAVNDVLENLLSSNEKSTENIGMVSEKTISTNDSAIKIKEAVALIQGIASQTNLLSLNASIEAARAGEAGRGFAVVAEEIRNLADESSSSAKTINEIVEELIKNSNESVSKMQEVSEGANDQRTKLEQTVNSFASLKDGVSEVSAVSDSILEQIDRLEHQKDAITSVVESLAAISEENAASTEETSSSMQLLTSVVDGCKADTEELNELSSALHRDVEIFRF